jgi:hypothetical protein
MHSTAQLMTADNGQNNTKELHQSEGLRGKLKLDLQLSTVSNHHDHTKFHFNS